MTDFDINALMRPRKICLCKSVTADAIRSAVRDNEVRSLKELIKQTKATTGCGTCLLEVKTALEKEIAEVEHPLFHQK